MTTPKAKEGDYGAVREAISNLLESNEDYDDGEHPYVACASHAT